MGGVVGAPTPAPFDEAAILAVQTQGVAALVAARPSGRAGSHRSNRSGCCSGTPVRIQPGTNTPGIPHVASMWASRRP